MEQEEKDALLALKDFMGTIGATQVEIEKEISLAMDKDPTVTPLKRKEVKEVLGFNKEKPVTQPKKMPLGDKPTPVKHSLIEIFKELKFGRSKEDQQFLDKAIAELAVKEQDKKTILRIKQKLNIVKADVDTLSMKDDADFYHDLIAELVEALNE